MPTRALSHDENRYKVCLLCFGKEKKMFPITNTWKSHIHTVYKKFTKNESLPASLCGKCRKQLYSDVSDKITLNLLIFPYLMYAEIHFDENPI